LEFNDTPIDNESNHVFDDSIELLTFIQVLFRTWIRLKKNLISPNIGLNVFWYLSSCLMVTHFQSLISLIVTC